jgi:hypothetical protein
MSEWVSSISRRIRRVRWSDIAVRMSVVNNPAGSARLVKSQEADDSACRSTVKEKGKSNCKRSIDPKHHFVCAREYVRSDFYSIAAWIVEIQLYNNQG